MKVSNIVTVVSFAPFAFSHGGIFTYKIDGEEYPGNPTELENTTWTNAVPDPTWPSIQRQWNFNPVYNVSGANITCNWRGTPGTSSLHATIAAGSNITARWDNFYSPPVWPQYWEHGAGPLLVYMARCPGSPSSCTGFSPAGSDAIWFKIAQTGLKPGASTLSDGNWQQWDLVGHMSSSPTDPNRSPGLTVTIPRDLREGAYLIRHEIIMLASQPAQFYPNCAQLMVKGSGKAEPESGSLVAFPGAYRADDPGIAMADWSISQTPVRDVYNTSVYPFPGPPVWTGPEVFEWEEDGARDETEESELGDEIGSHHSEGGRRSV
ncbi:hypothetical protein G7Y89_g542 [Cudoniella acicularis]|uniref:AA9 family lytic polysaccharide monooxygenase n=1 Tax=Cudoniella acicularis TaxID=354080 RepID=A0A8H4WAC5_9HELO|nr:hypothetical protein G7Y89_g542 [Cudoniella acicularis]